MKTTKMTKMKPLLLALVFGSALVHADDALNQKFNILRINADDHRADCLGALGNPLVKTPNLDALVERGLTFTHCYTMGAMIGAACQPSRTMMLTGKLIISLTRPTSLSTIPSCNAPPPLLC